MPFWIKKIVRLLRYKNEWKKTFREVSIIKQQNKLFKKNYQKEAQKLIVFLIPGADWATGKEGISGGAISIVSLCEETQSLYSSNNEIATILCTIREDHLLVKYKNFENRTPVYRFSQLHKHFRDVKEVVIHAPEFITTLFVKRLIKKDKKWLQSRQFFQINILNQNISLMPSQTEIQEIKQVTNFVTITTAHQQYCTIQYREFFGVPTHKLSVWISPEQYSFVSWREKENLIVISPEKRSYKKEIIEELKKVEGLRIQIIENLKYSEYKQLVARAKWTLTFGEGLDGYLIEPVFSGAIGFAIYNEQFFTKDFSEFQTIYSSPEMLKSEIVSDIQKLDNEEDFSEYQKKQYTLLAAYYKKEEYINNLKKFYNKDYTFC